MKKLFIWLFVLIVLIIGAGIFLVSTQLDYLTKLAIEYYGSEILNTTVQVKRVNIDVERGNASVRDLVINNPEDFSLPSAFSVNKISIDLDTKHSSSDTIIFNKILIRAPTVSYEVNQHRETNLSILENNIASATSSEAQSGNSDPKIIIRQFTMENGALKALIAPARNKKYDLALPSIQLKNLGGKGGSSPAEISQQIYKAIYKAAQSELKRKGITAKYEKKLDAEKQRLNEKVDNKLESKKSDLKNKLKGLL